MLKRFTQPYDARLIDAIQSDKPDVVAKRLTLDKLGKLSQDEKNTLVNAALSQANSKILSLLLAALGESVCQKNSQWLLVSLEQTNALALLTELLHAKVPASDLTLIDAVVSQKDKGDWLMIISRLAEHGLAVEQHPTLLTTALRNDHQNLVHYLIEAGSELPTEQPQGCSDDIWLYAKRCADNKAVRALLGP
ncbi:MAG: hypothetical protein ACPGMR_12040 [Pontibacterium sp.]